MTEATGWLLVGAACLALGGLVGCGDDSSGSGGTGGHASLDGILRNEDRDELTYA